MLAMLKTRFFCYTGNTLSITVLYLVDLFMFIYMCIISLQMKDVRQNLILYFRPVAPSSLLHHTHARSLYLNVL